MLQVRDLAKHFVVRDGFWGAKRTVRAVDGVDLDVARGEIVGLVGESGSGKTTLGRAILRLLEPTRGSIVFDGLDVRAQDARSMRRLRRRMQLVFQDPVASLNPRMRVRALVGEPLVVHKVARGSALTERVVTLLDEVGLGADALDRYPHEFSGGQRQRIGIARALALRPDFVVCDEPVSSLDVSVRAQIINLLASLQMRHQMAYLFIAHDLALVSHLADRVVIFYLGRVVESGPAAQLAERPTHPYTRALFDASPPPDPDEARARLRAVPGEPASAADRPQGCAYHPRCPLAKDVCRVEDPPLRLVEPGVHVACHRADEARAFDSGATLRRRDSLSPVDGGAPSTGSE